MESAPNPSATPARSLGGAGRVLDSLAERQTRSGRTASDGCRTCLPTSSSARPRAEVKETGGSRRVSLPRSRDRRLKWRGS